MIRYIYDRLTELLIYQNDGKGLYLKWIDIGTSTVQYDANYYDDHVRKDRREEVNEKKLYKRNKRENRM